MARPKDKNSRRSKADRRRAERAALAAANLGLRADPNARVAERRLRFSFLGSGRIDQDIHDGIGQLHALGFLNDHGHEAKDLRDIGRDFADLYWERYEATAPAIGQFERRSRGTGEPPPRNGRYDRFDRLDESLPRSSMERTAIHMLLTEHYHSDEMVGWVSRLVADGLAQKGVPDTPDMLNPMTWGHDKFMLGCAVRGLCQLMDAGLPARFQRLAA
jgi:hypothetical protein